MQRLLLFPFSLPNAMSSNHCDQTTQYQLLDQAMYQELPSSNLRNKSHRRQGGVG